MGWNAATILLVPKGWKLHLTTEEVNTPGTQTTVRMADVERDLSISPSLRRDNVRAVLIAFGLGLTEVTASNETFVEGDVRVDVYVHDMKVSQIWCEFTVTKKVNGRVAH